MKRIEVQINDNYMSAFMSYVNSHSQNITISKNPNLELDPYFYERQKELYKIRDDIKNDKIKMLSHEKVWGNIKSHLNTIKNR